MAKRLQNCAINIHIIKEKNSRFAQTIVPYENIPWRNDCKNSQQKYTYNKRKKLPLHINDRIKKRAVLF